jgi:ABC-type sulfate transport system permease subunit
MDKRTSAVAIALCWSSTIVYYVPLIRADNTRYDNRYLGLTWFEVSWYLSWGNMLWALTLGLVLSRWEAMREVLKLKTSKVICFDMIEALRLLLEAGIRGTQSNAQV